MIKIDMGTMRAALNDAIKAKQHGSQQFARICVGKDGKCWYTESSDDDYDAVFFEYIDGIEDCGEPIENYSPDDIAEVFETWDRGSSDPVGILA